MWISPIKTPGIVQVDFGPWGQNLPGDGESYCGPTSIVMGLYWLSANGFTQVAPSTYTGQNDPAAVNLELVVAGLLGTSSETGTSSMDGVTTYLAACGIAIAPDQNPSIANPDLDWIVEHVGPNVASNPESIVLAQFSVGWYSTDQSDPSQWDNDGGHVLVPIGLTPEGLLLNNAYPASFYDVPNLPENAQQVVQIVPVPSGLTLEYLDLPSQDYSQIVSGNKGSNGSYAVLWNASTWIIPSSARPATRGYQPAIWTIDSPQVIDTNGGNLPVLAPLTGAGGFSKGGDGVLLLTKPNRLSGTNIVSGGILASTQTSGAPFGTGPVILQGGGLQLGVDADGAVTATIASGEGATLAVDAEGGGLALSGTGGYAVTIGGNTDGRTANVTRQAAGTLVVAPGGGTAALGSTQQVLVAGSGGNLLPVGNGIVAPWLLGQDSDAPGSGVFLDYDDTAGLEPAAVTLSSDVGIGSLPGDDTIYDVVDMRTLQGRATATVAALEVSGGEAAGPDATLTVGGRARGDVAGVIMNGGTISVGTLAFGASEAVIYASNDGGTIDSALSGSGGLTTFGPGSLVLVGDSSTTLSGDVTVNAGTLVLSGAAGSPTGSGDIVVNAGATLQVTGTGGLAGSTVTVGSSGILNMDGGTLASNVVITAIGNDDYPSDPGGILQGNGTIGGTVTVGGGVQAGRDFGILTFGGAATFQEDAALYWQLQGYHEDDENVPLGTWWNVLTFNSPDSVIGAEGAAVSMFVDFSKLDGDPDGGNPFWLKQRTWTFMTFPNGGGSGWWTFANFSFLGGDFVTLPWTGTVVQLQWRPLMTKRTPDERRRAEAVARRRPVGR